MIIVILIADIFLRLFINIMNLYSDFHGGFGIVLRQCVYCAKTRIGNKTEHQIELQLHI